MNKLLLLIDFSAVYYRAALVSGPDTPINEARKATIETIGRIGRLFEGQETATVICCDSKSNWRKKLDSTYKANREKQPDSFYVEMECTKERLAADGYHVVEREGFEADDVIASIVYRSPDETDVIVCSPDKDLLQLVGIGVRQLRTHAMFKPDGTTVDLWDEMRVLETFGVKPSRLGDYLALVGDDADNIPGVPGVAGKGAAALLSEFGTLNVIMTLVEGLAGQPHPVSPFQSKSLSRWNTALERFFLTKPKEAVDRLARNRILVQLKEDIEFNTDEFFVKKEVKPLSSDGFDDKPKEEAVEADFIEIGAEKQPEPVQQDGQPTVNAIAKIDPVSQFDASLQPTGMSGCWWLANRAASSRLYSKFDTPERALMVMARGKDFGLSPTAAMELLQVIEGKICPPAQVIHAMVQRHPDCAYFYVKDVKNGTEEATATAVGCRTLKDGTKGPEQSFTYSIADARQAGLVKDKSGWAKNPGAMCVARATSWLARWMFPDATTGALSWEEMEGER